MPAVVREADDRDSLLLALVENVAREQLSPVEEARAYALLIDEFGLSLGEVSERVGRSKPSVSNRMRLLDLPDDVLGMVERGELTEGHARAVLAVPDQEGRRRLAREIVKTGMSVRAAERRRAGPAPGRSRAERSAPVDPALAARVRAAAERLTGLPVRVTRGRLEIQFADEYELAELAEALERYARRNAGGPWCVAPAWARGSWTSNRSSRSRRTRPRVASCCAWRSSRERAGSSPS